MQLRCKFFINNLVCIELRLQLEYQAPLHFLGSKDDHQLRVDLWEQLHLVTDLISITTCAASLSRISTPFRERLFNSESSLMRRAESITPTKRRGWRTKGKDACIRCFSSISASSSSRAASSRHLDTVCLMRKSWPSRREEQHFAQEMLSLIICSVNRPLPSYAIACTVALAIRRAEGFVLSAATSQLAQQYGTINKVYYNATRLAATPLSSLFISAFPLVHHNHGPVYDARTGMLSGREDAHAVRSCHHLFYSSLQARDISQTTFDQARNINIGTAFAFLVKICLSIAIGAAYAQVLWRTFLHRSLSVAQIDSLSSLITSPGLDGIGHAVRFPALMAVATIGWFISVATIFPPGTLSVHGEVDSNRTTLTVPTLDFSQPIIQRVEGRSISASGINVQPGDPSYYTFPAPPRAIASVLSTMTAFTGIPRVSGAQSNTSYSVSFYGPALQCSTSQVNTSPVFCDGDDGGGLSKSSVYYTSFLKYPQDSGSSFRRFWDLNASVPSGGNDTISCNEITSYRTSVFGNTPPELYVVLLGTDTVNITGWNVTTCQLLNATYSVNTSFPDGQQVISTKVDELTPLKSTIDYFEGYHGNISDITNITAGTNGIYNYLAMMALMGQIAVGTVNSASGSQQMSYEEGASLDVTSAEVPSIFSTRLTTSPEMKALHEAVFTLSDIADIEDSAFEGSTAAPLAQQLEELFQNLTVAMSTNPSTSSNQSVTGLVDFPINRYAYQAEHLWISYGIGILLTALIVVLAYFAVASNGAPYSTKYSTFLRTTPWQAAEKSLAGEAHLGDLGSDPVHLGNATPSGVESEILLGDAQKAGATPMVPTVPQEQRWLIVHPIDYVRHYTLRQNLRKGDSRHYPKSSALRYLLKMLFSCLGSMGVVDANYLFEWDVGTEDGDREETTMTVDQILREE
ncbi:uncharacterized protein MYCFIDRAFT_208546 [Pseudocercospora fijiensis CIRAD86]|uniref:Uncharacterized protein n=1 Tax=Pseudocercospora fijiensis (strain CIRAD86) TaxID=383855 RepID=M3AT51_PSEFD|nr:uncharacterized protein MYCFIDRAFT_208546 [Pseudocercospora fijiensis CIRAD86]EME80298.1 hypothetical protein MYCFIDRAFT_208546 [Pseudocercospora fijiensis CIRAD86]